MERIKSFDQLDKKINERKYRDKIGDKYDDFLYYQALDRLGKQKYLKNQGINFFETTGYYEPKSEKIIMNYKNPFTGDFIVFNAKGKHLSDNLAKIKGHITINYNANCPEKVFGFIPAHHEIHYERPITGVPTQSKSAYEREKKRAIAESKSKSNELKKQAYNKEKELLAHIDELCAHERIYFDDFVTVNNVNYCLSNGHDVEEIKALIFILRSNGKIMPKMISAGYCHDCNRHFIEKWQYENLKEYGVPLCQVINEHIYYNGGLNYFDDLEPESILHRSGYNVSAAEGLSSIQRHKILSLLLESGICSRHKITSHITWLIDSRCGMDHMENAISKWKEDRKFASNFDLEENRTVGIKLIRNRICKNLNKC